MLHNQNREFASVNDAMNFIIDAILNNQAGQIVSAIEYIKKNLSGKDLEEKLNLIDEMTSQKNPAEEKSVAIHLSTVIESTAKEAWKNKIKITSPEHAAQIIVDAEKNNVFYTDYYDAISYIKENRTNQGQEFFAHIQAIIDNKPKITKPHSSYDPRFMPSAPPAPRELERSQATSNQQRQQQQQLKP